LDEDIAFCLVMALPLIMMLAMTAMFALGYRTVPPNRALVLFRQDREGKRQALGMIQGGGRFMMPGARNTAELDMTVDMTEFELSGVPTSSSGPTTSLRLKMVALWYITRDLDELKERASTLLDRTHGENEMAVKDQLEAAIRDISSGLSPESMQCDRRSIEGKTVKVANAALADLGIEVLTIRLLEIKPKG
jgi:uncharacterized membrane protein YqiK